MITYSAEGVKMPKIKKREISRWIKAVADVLNGDLVISLDTVRSNAELFKKSYEDELNRVIIHGILHLCGINDKGPGEREIMEENENKALALLKEMSDK